MTSLFRIEHDSIGPVRIPADALYGPQTQRALNNFPISGRPLPPEFIRALGWVKAACAEANAVVGGLDPKMAAAISLMGQRIGAGHYLDSFLIDVYQTGSGTSTNMNANEVIARLATDSGIPVHPNDHVNMSQSSNDVIPTTIRVAAVESARMDLLPALDHLSGVLALKAESLGTVTKTGRTHLMDAMPIRFDQALGAFIDQLAGARLGVVQAMDRLSALPQGGTAVGTGINAPDGFGSTFIAKLNQLTDGGYRLMPRPFAGLSAQDEPVAYSAALRGLAIVLTKIANDLRWMNAGPLAGLGEISLPDLQPGSSIMPGKVNPVIPEAVAMVSAQVQGLDAAVALAGQSGNFELNVMLPLIAQNVLESTRLLTQAMRLLADKAIAGFTVNQTNIARALSMNPILVTALNPVIGYELGAKIAKRAYAEQRSVLEIALEMTDLSEGTLKQLLDPYLLTGSHSS
ncbi:MAG: class II fumarate hydratase [Halothiobacillus sp.]|jgi:fumarate hydratase class II|nr:class II fumarate hydratase [Halothiobacillus sp.]